MPDHPGGLTREHVVWAYRLLLDRDPESEDVIAPKLAGSRDTRELRHHLMTSSEFQEKNRDYAHTNDRTVVITELENGVRLFVDLSDHVIGLNIVRGQYERDATELVRQTLHPGDTAIDAGAHVGLFAIQMAAAVGGSGVVYAFEPFGPSADLVARSIAENHFENRVVLRRSAVGAASGTATLTFPVETLNTGGAYVVRPGTVPMPGHRTTEVPIVALDDLDIRRPVRLIKMDVEGAEPLVVRGAARLIAEDRPLIISELHPAQLDRVSGVGAADFLDEMRRLGYHATTLDGSPLDRAPADTMASVILRAS